MDYRFGPEGFPPRLRGDCGAGQGPIARRANSSADLIWRRYGHVFEEARLAPNVSMVEAIETARAKLEEAGLRPGCAESNVRIMRA